MAVIEWQASLFGSVTPAADAAFVSCRRTELRDGAWIDHQVGWLAGADELFAELVARAPWRQRTRPMYEQVVAEPRLTAWFGAKEGDLVLPAVVVEMKELLSQRYGVRFDSVGCNLYRDGRDSVAWHGDTVRKSLAEPLVAIVSLGAARPLLLRPRGGGASIRHELGGGDLFVMGGTCQHTCEHCVPKGRAAGPRLSVTFRHSRGAGRSARAAPRSAAGRGPRR
jgi:alkylated DNA repair dioxygenase AlkB